MTPSGSLQSESLVMIPVNDSIEEMQKVTFDFEKGQTLHKEINSEMSY